MIQKSRPKTLLLSYTSKKFWALVISRTGVRNLFIAFSIYLVDMELLHLISSKSKWVLCSFVSSIFTKYCFWIIFTSMRKLSSLLVTWVNKTVNRSKIIFSAILVPRIFEIIGVNCSWQFYIFKPFFFRKWKQLFGRACIDLKCSQAVWWLWFRSH